MSLLFIAPMLVQDVEATEFSALWGVVVPGAVLAIAFVATYLLYRHFVEHSG